MNDATLPQPPATMRAAPQMMPLERIAPSSRFQPRRKPVSLDDDEGLALSIASPIGLLDPILLWRVPDAAIETWEIVAGSRRRAALVALGRTEIPFTIFTGTEAEAHAAATASNTQRAALAPVDTWRAIRGLQDLGWPLDDAARALGIALRTAQRLDRLGQLHPEILAAIETGGLPEADSWEIESLHAIASAPFDVQARAVKDKHAFSGKGPTRAPNWDRLEDLCKVERIARGVAIFDVAASGILFEEDLFAPPGDPRAFTTSDVAGFLAAQRQALQDQVAAYRGKKKRHAVRFDAKKGIPAIPAGWTITYDDRVAAEVYEAVVETGHDIGKIQTVKALPPAKVLAERQAAETARKESAPGSQDSQSGAPGAPAAEAAEAEEREEEREPAAVAAPPKPSREPVTKLGQQLIAQAKTAGIRTALKDRRDQLTDRELLQLLVLAIAGDNVRITGNAAAIYQAQRFEDLAARLIGPDGQPIADLPPEAVRDAAAEAARRIVVCSPVRLGDSSGRAAEWIGAMLRPTLPRLDTPEILATVRGADLAIAAIAAGDTGKGTTKALRDRLANACPDLQLPGCGFKAEGPDPRALEEDGEEEGEGDE